MMNNFSDSIKFLYNSVQKYLIFLPDEIKENTYEIRLRRDKPIVLFGKYGVLFINKDFTYSSVDSSGAYIVSKNELNETVASICKYSVYSHQNDIINGFVTFGNGNRAGFGGKAVVENGKISSISDISSLNIRIAFQNPYLPVDIKCLLDNFSGILIAGPPCSGKTTILKVIAQTVSSDYFFGFQKTVVIDERYEMQNINAVNCDILSGYPKAYGIEHAVRTLSPQIIICDEIVSSEEIIRMAEGMYCGVRFVASMHLSSVDDMKKSPLFAELMSLGIFDYVVLLRGGKDAGKIEKVIRTEELKNDNQPCNYYSDSIGCYGISDN